MKNPQLQYDGESKILSIRLRRNKSVDSDTEGNIVLDYDQDGNLVNIDIMHINLNNFGPSRSFFTMKSRHKIGQRV